MKSDKYDKIEKQLGVNKMKYKCLVLDHDDTVVKSTPTIHYPSFIEAMKELRPQMEPYTLETFCNLLLQAWIPCLM